MAIIAFSGQGLKVIDLFKQFCNEFSRDTTQTFLRDLEAAACVLNDTMTLARKSEEVAKDLHLDFRAHSLAIQVEDCAHDLEAWLDSARLIKSRKKKSSAVSVYGKIQAALSKSSIDDKTQRLQWHLGSIQTSLNIFGRHVDMTNAAALKIVNNTVVEWSSKMEDHADRIDDKLSSISNSLSTSTNSLRAQNSEVSDKLDMVTKLLQQVVSSQDRRSGSEYIRDVKDPNLPDRSSDDQCPELELVNKATNSLRLSLLEFHEPLICEFLATLHAYQTMEFQFACQKVQFSGQMLSSSASRKELFESITRSLLTIRKRCIFEGLGETIDSATNELGLDAAWLPKLDDTHSTAHRVEQGPKLPIKHLPVLNAEARREDQLIWMNEWLLHVFNSYRSSLNLYTAIAKSRFGPTTPGYVIRNILEGPESTFIIGNDEVEQTLRRSILKVWFLDSAASTTHNEYPDSIAATSDTEATFQQIEDTSEDDREGEDGRLRIVNRQHAFLEQLLDERLPLLQQGSGSQNKLVQTRMSEHILGHVKKEDFAFVPKGMMNEAQQYLELAPDGVSKEDIRTAVLDLEEYRLT